jgi:hypothetical protein
MKVAEPRAKAGCLIRDARFWKKVKGQRQKGKIKKAESRKPKAVVQD